MLEKNSASLKTSNVVGPLTLFTFLVVWWVIIQLVDSDAALFSADAWADVYQVMAITGGVLGLAASFNWGGTKSLIGKALIAFSVGLLLQAFGQSVYAYYAIFKDVEVPYPSLGDVGFFGSIPFYIYGAYLMARVSGFHVSLKSYRGKILAFLIPSAMLVMSYVMFLRGYDISEVPLIQILLDFGYPFGQAMYVSLVLLVYFTSRNLLGGVLRKPFQILFIAVFIQYLADYFFLYLSSRELWTVGGFNDLMYLTAYFVMTYAILSFNKAYKTITSDSN